jgi:transposase
VRTYAPRGETPVLRAPLSYDHLSAISAITPDGQLLMQVQEQAYTSTEVVQFLRHLLRHIPGKLLIVWDGACIHRSQPIKEFLAQGGAERIHLERLPSYAPELNPDEGIWRYLKRVELKNVAHGNLVCADGSPKHIRRMTCGVIRLALVMVSNVTTYRCRLSWCTPRNTRKAVRKAAPAPSQVLQWTSRIPSPSSSRAHSWME